LGLFESNHYERHHHEHTTTVREVRAPTDESVRLLREMEKAAHESVVNAVRVKDCPIDAVIHQQIDQVNCRNLFKVIYSVNGKRHTVDTAVDSWTSEEEAVQKLIHNLAADIAVTLLAPHIRAAMGRF
jgi:hypothetical protein